MNPTYPLAKAALESARDAGLVTRETWSGLLNLAVYDLAQVNALAAVIAAGCGNCLTKDTFG